MDKFSVKPATTFAEQLSILKKRNLVIEDDDFALSVLMSVNYYRFTGYLLPFKNGDDTYAAGTTFEKAFHTYEFDRRLRNLLIGVLETIEIRLRTHISYHLAHTYGPLGYLQSENFRNEAMHGKFLESLYKSLREAHKNRELFAIHHFEKYQGSFPIWVAVETMSFGILSKLYMNMRGLDRSTIAKRVYGIPQEYLGSWMESLVYVRNMCAHYTRLYDKELKIKPLLFRDVSFSNDRLFAVLFICKRLYAPAREWNNGLLLNLQSLIDQYKDRVDISRLGFPEDWLDILRL